MDTHTQNSAGNEEFGLKVKALIKSREQLKEQNTQLEQRITELQDLIKSKAVPAAQPAVPAAAPYIPPQPVVSVPQPIYQPQPVVSPPPVQPLYQPQTQLQPAYPPPVYPAYRVQEPLYFRQSETERIRADALAEAQRIVDDARRQADAIYAAAEMSLRSLSDDLENAFNAARKKLGEVTALYATREKVIGNMFSGRE